MDWRRGDYRGEEADNEVIGNENHQVDAGKYLVNRAKNVEKRLRCNSNEWERLARKQACKYEREMCWLVDKHPAVPTPLYSTVFTAISPMCPYNVDNRHFDV